MDERCGEAHPSRTESQRAATEQAGPQAVTELGPLVIVPFHASWDAGPANFLQTCCVIVGAGPQDVRFLRDMLKHAYHWRLNEDPDLPVARYVNGWGRPGDVGLIAWENGPVGAAWYRRFPASAPGFGFVDEQTPELTIAVVPSRRGSGLGGQLLEALLTRAKEDGHAAISLSAEKGMTKLYERFGFQPVEDKDGTVTMRADLG